MTMTDKRTTRYEHAPVSPELLTVAEVARILRWDVTTVRRHISNGVIPAWAVVFLPHQGKRASYRLKRTWLENMLASNEKE